MTALLGSTCNHEWQISFWQYSKAGQRANCYTCKYCLHTLEGRTAIEAAKHELQRKYQKPS
jgi:hypothetical protein